ncbi:MAG: hypothetical protein VYE40_07190 [Myxococcota bacterium]|nr:hypothetical protein [Myxococcota bacterium]MEC9440866.1 hypothetical protein [Myxococcota bacterium]
MEARCSRSISASSDFLFENGVAIYSRSGGTWCLTGRIESERRSNLFASDMQVAWQEGVATLVFGAPGSGGNIKGGAFVAEVELAMGVDECVNQLADAPLTVAEELDVEDDTLALVGSGVAISPGGETIAVSVPTFLVQGKTQGGFIVFRKDAATGDWSRQYDVRGSAPLSYFRSGGDAGPASMGQRMAFFNEHYLVAAGEYDASENELNTDCVFRTNDRLEIHRLKETEAELMWSKNTPTEVSRSMVPPWCRLSTSASKRCACCPGRRRAVSGSSVRCPRLTVRLSRTEAREGSQMS